MIPDVSPSGLGRINSLYRIDSEGQRESERGSRSRRRGNRSDEDHDGGEKGDNRSRARSRQSNRTEEDQEVEREKRGEGKEDEEGPGTDEGCPTVSHGEQERDHNVPHRVHHRYLPIVSGLICPFSVLLEIPGLTERWYVRTDGDTVVETQPNPIILDVALAISLALGLLANVALICRFLERRPYQSTIVAIVALSVHDVINVITVTYFAVIHRFNDGFTYGDAYWMTVASTTASLVCNVTLIWDFVMTKDFRKNGSGLTEKQRSLVIAVMILLCYIGLGSLVFSFLIVTPHLSFIDSLYFTVCTVTSVGFGDITPTSTSSRIFSFPYDIVGLAILAFTIAIARETVIETFEAGYRLRREILAKKARERKEERKKRDKERRERRVRDASGAATERTTSMPPIMIRGQPVGSRIKRWWNKMWSWLRRKKVDTEGINPLGMVRTLTATSLVQEETYKTFKRQMQKEQDNEFRVKIGIALVLFAMFWFIGAMVFHFTEQWTYFESLYFCFIFFTTIGYGDFSPKSSAGRAFFVAWSIFGIATMTLLLSVLTESWSSRYKSSITSSKIRRTIHRVSAHPSNAPREFTSAARQLLGVEGFEDEDGKEVDVVQKLVQSVRGFHDHARYFMHGRTGDTPESLRGLVDAADEFDDELNRLREDGDLAESGVFGETRHFLFMVSYERSFDMLIEAAEQISGSYAAHAAEIEQMRGLNARLREALSIANENASGSGSVREIDEDESTKSSDGPSLLPFHKRPPGGEGDDEVEREIEREIDGDSEEGGEGKEEDEGASLNGLTPAQVYEQSVEMIRTMEASPLRLVIPRTPTRQPSLSNSFLSPTSQSSDPSSSSNPITTSPKSISVAPLPEASTSSQLPITPARNPSLSMSRTPTLTFDIPTLPERGRSYSTTSGILGRTPEK